jgi:hypothetical protein
MSSLRLTCVSTGCIYMTYGPRQRRPESRASQSSTRAASAVRSTSGCGGTIIAGLFYLSPASLSVPPASAASQRTRPCERGQVGVHCQASTQFDSSRAVVRLGEGIVDQRGRQSGFARTAPARARAWVSRSQFGYSPFSWNIGLTVCCQRSWPRSTKRWYRICAGPSEERFLNQRERIRR